jgi:hypothetical protein
MPRKLSFGTEDKRRSMTKMTREERKLFDAQADHEAWSVAHEILEPWVRTTRPIGSDELTQVMEKALAHVEMEPNRTRDVLGPSKRAWRHTSTSCPSWRALAGLPVLRSLKSGCEPQATTTQRTSCLKPPGGWMGRARQRDPAVDGRGAGAHRLGLCADIFLS